MAHYRLSQAATADLSEISRYTTKTWGGDQATAYLAGLRDRMRWLAGAPKRGKARPDLQEGLYSFLQQSHVIYYRIGRKGIEVVRVLHRRRDPDRHISRTGPSPT